MATSYVKLLLFANFVYTLNATKSVSTEPSADKEDNLSLEAAPLLSSSLHLKENSIDHSEFLQDLCIDLLSNFRNPSQAQCLRSKSGIWLSFGYCITYNKETETVSLSKCPTVTYITSHHYNMTRTGYILLPRNLSQLNDYMCGPLNRKGLVCSECADGFGPSVTSFGYECANCTNTWYGVPLFLVVEFVPITVFYLIILVFQINMYVAPIPCFIMYAQCVVAFFYLSTFTSTSLRDIVFNNSGDIRLDMKILHVLYGILNLDFFKLVLPPFCFNSRLKSITIAFLGYISVIYPLFLIFLTWVCIELHGRNFRPLVWLWRPFHRCFVRLRRGWDTKSDIIDVFITFLLLSYNKSMFQSLVILTQQSIYNYNSTGKSISIYPRTFTDISVPYRSTHHLLVIIPSAIIFLTLNVLPPLLLTFYPIRAFRSCLSKCRPAHIC